MSERLDSITEELLALKNAQGRINPVEVVAWARKHPKSWLHSALTWDNAVAADRHRIWEVRALISVHIVDNDGGRRFVSLSIDRPAGGYRPVAEVMHTAALREVMLADALADIERLQKRYDRLTELATVWDEAAKVRQSRKKAA